MIKTKSYWSSVPCNFQFRAKSSIVASRYYFSFVKSVIIISIISTICITNHWIFCVDKGTKERVFISILLLFIIYIKLNISFRFPVWSSIIIKSIIIIIILVILFIFSTNYTFTRTWWVDILKNWWCSFTIEMFFVRRNVRLSWTESIRFPCIR